MSHVSQFTGAHKALGPIANHVSLTMFPSSNLLYLRLHSASLSDTQFTVLRRGWVSRLQEWVSSDKEYTLKTDNHPHGMRTSHKVVPLRNVSLSPNLLSCFMMSYYLSSSSFKGMQIITLILAVLIK